MKKLKDIVEAISLVCAGIAVVVSCSILLYVVYQVMTGNIKIN